MGATTSIEWTDATWNPVRGCSRVSPGCGGPNHEGGCYAETIAARFSDPGQPFHGYAERTKHGGRWTGKLALVEAALGLPLRWRKPRRIFVNSMSDLFHENLPDEAIDEVFAVMALCPRHTFQVLTKRPARMEKYFAKGNGLYYWHGDKIAALPWPLSNVWLGVSAERQQEADERIPHLLQTPAAIRFVSCEPLLGSINLRHHLGISPNHDDLRGLLNWIIVGGESGPGARPMHPDWARSLRDQCEAASAAFFFKQWGEWKGTGSVDVYCHGPDRKKRQYPDAPGIAWLSDGRILLQDFTVAEHAARIRARQAYNTRAVEVDAGALADWRAALRRADKEQSSAPTDRLGLQWMYRVGKRAAGRLLDGRTWDEFPQVAP